MDISYVYPMHRSNTGHYTVKCIVEGYPRTISAQRAKIFGSAFMVKALTNHTCELSEPLRQHWNVTSSYVASLISHLVAADVSISSKMLMSKIVNLIGYSVNYSKVR